MKDIMSMGRQVNQRPERMNRVEIIREGGVFSAGLQSTNSICSTREGHHAGFIKTDVVITRAELAAEWIVAVLGQNRKVV